MTEEASTDGPVIRVEFSLTRDEWIRFTRWHVLHLPPVRYQALSAVLLLTGSLVLLAAGTTMLGVVLLVASASWIGWFGWFAATTGRRSWTRRGDDIGAPQVIEFSDAGVHSQTATVDARAGWSVYTRLIEHSGLYLLGTKSRLVFRVVPQRAFASASDEAAFRQMAQTHID